MDFLTAKQIIQTGNYCTSLKKQRTNLSEIQPAKGEPKWKSMI